MKIDEPLTKRAADLLRNPANVDLLGAAAPLLGKIGVEYRPAPPPKEPKPKPPPRAGGKPAESGEVSAPPPGPPPMPSPWNRAAVAKRANTHAKFEDGSPLAVVITVDGACWEKLNERGRTRALMQALRSIRHKESAAGGDVVKIEKPPICCWPDMTEAAVDLIDQLGPDGAVGAALTGCFVDPDEIEALATALAKFRRRLDAGQDLTSKVPALRRLLDILVHISVQAARSDCRTVEVDYAGDAYEGEPVNVVPDHLVAVDVGHLYPDEEIEDDGPSDNGPSGDIERH